MDRGFPQNNRNNVKLNSPRRLPEPALLVSGGFFLAALRLSLPDTRPCTPSQPPLSLRHLLLGLRRPLCTRYFLLTLQCAAVPESRRPFCFTLDP